jgi:3-oxoacyl-[acyl-carrier protein] reductase
VRTSVGLLSGSSASSYQYGVRVGVGDRVEVEITSVSVRQPIPTIILSNTSRAGVTGFLKTVAREVAPDGVTVNTVQPGLHATDRALQLGDPSAMAAGIPVGALGDPADFGAIVTFLCSEQSKFVTGLQLHVDGGTYGGLQ